MSDTSSPDHYKGKVQFIEDLDACMSDDQFEGFLFGMVLKYVHRYPSRRGVEDLRKAQVYLHWLIERVSRAEADQ
jgi:hypothetical protein